MESDQTFICLQLNELKWCWFANLTLDNTIFSSTSIGGCDLLPSRFNFEFKTITINLVQKFAVFAQVFIIKFYLKSLQILTSNKTAFCFLRSFTSLLKPLSLKYYFCLWIKVYRKSFSELFDDATRPIKVSAIYVKLLSKVRADNVFQLFVQNRFFNVFKKNMTFYNTIKSHELYYY